MTPLDAYSQKIDFEIDKLPFDNRHLILLL